MAQHSTAQHGYKGMDGTAAENAAEKQSYLGMSHEGHAG
jgi:hypothetical protein